MNFTELIIPVVIGLAIIIIGIFNARGNLSLIHGYHRRRVAPEDVLPFGRLVGIGNIIIGVAVIITSILGYVAKITAHPFLEIFGTVILIVAVVVGIGLAFFAMIKYNKGIF